MKKSSSAVSKISMEMFIHQGSWALGILFVIFVINIILGIASDGVREDYFSIAYRFTKGFMVVAGIISCSGFLSYYVRNGLTRREFFNGAVLAAIFLSLAIPLIAGAVNLVLGMLSFWGNASTPLLLNFNNNWFLVLASYSIQIFIYYLMGWMIGAGVYRYDWIPGIGFVAVAFILVSFMDVLWQFELASLWERWLPMASVTVPLPISLAGSLAVIAAALVLIRLLTRRVPIKL